jgi:cobalamin-dependent methionine synthase I
MLSGVIRRQLANALDRHLQSASGPRVLFTTLSGERHEMGGLMGAVLAASRGYQCIYLGPDLPPEEIARFCAHQPVDALALSLVTQPDVIDAFAQLRELRENVPSNVEIWVAGQAAAILGRQPLPDGVHTLRDLEAFLQRLAALTRS